MLLRRFTDFVLQSRVSAMATAFILAFLPLVGSISILIAVLVTLRKGVFEGALVLVAATAPYLLSYFATSVDNETQLIMTITVGVTILSNIVTWILALPLRKYSDWNITLELGMLLGILAVAIVHFINPNVQTWWGTQLSAYFSKSTSLLSQLNGTSGSEALPKDIRPQAIAYVKQYATGLIAASLLVNATMQLLLARWWQAIVFNPGGLRSELYRIRLSYVSAAAFILALVLSFFGNTAALDMMPVICVTFAAAGFSLFHSIMGPTKAGWVWLALMYLVTIWMLPISIVFIAVVALFDTLFNIRKRWNKH